MHCKSDYLGKKKGGGVLLENFPYSIKAGSVYDEIRNYLLKAIFQPALISASEISRSGQDLTSTST